MMSGKMTVEGGKMRFEKMTKKNMEADPINYELAKIQIWSNMINDLMRPTKWRNPTTKGTSVDFDVINTQEDYDNAIIDLKAQIEKVNKKYDAQIEINFTPKGA